MPASTTIPEGPASKYGKAAAAVLALVAVLLEAFDVELDTETLGVLAGVVALLWKYMDGRYKQATAKIETQTKPDVTDLAMPLLPRSERVDFIPPGTMTLPAPGPGGRVTVGHYTHTDDAADEPA